MITDGNGCYIRHDAHSKRYVPVRGEKYGDVWEKREKASNICGSLPRRLRQFYFVMQVEREAAAESVKTEAPSVVHTDPVLEQDDVLKVWQSRINAAIHFAEDIVRRSEELNNLLSALDSELTDLDHYLEFNFKHLNAYQGFMMTKMRYNVLEKRRKIKDEMSVIKDVRGCLPTGEGLDQALKTIDGMDARSYKPRVLKSLFEEGIS